MWKIPIGISPFFKKGSGGGSPPGPQNVQATGGTITYITNASGTFKQHQFDDPDDVTYAFNLIANSSNIPIGLMAAAGGGRGGGGNGGGGGGAGDLYYNPDWTPVLGIYNITVGAGGIIDSNPTIGKGGDTVVGAITVEGGGIGANSASNTPGGNPAAGGSRGGAGGTAGAYNLKVGGGSAEFGTGGGGGCGTAGTTGLPGLGGGPTNIINGNGGDGMEITVAGVDMQICAGGAGGNTNEADNFAFGGAGGGGDALPSPDPGGNGTGIGCGGAGSTAAGPGAGFRGEVIIWYAWTGPEVDYGAELTMLSSNVSGVSGRDSALYVNISPTASLMLGGWNPAFGGSSITDEAYITSDFITFTPIDAMPAKMDHGFAGIRNDGYLWVVGSNNVDGIVVMKLYIDDYLSSGDPADLVWTMVDSHVIVYGACGAIQDDLLKILAWNGTNAEVWVSSTGLTADWTKESDLPAGYIVSAGMYVTDANNLRVGGGADDDDSLGTLYDKVLEWDGVAWNESCTLPFNIQGCWVSLFQKGIYEYAIGGWNNGAENEFTQGMLWRRLLNGDAWELLGFDETVNKHAIPSVVRGNYIYVGFGSNLSHNWSMRINKV